MASGPLLEWILGTSYRFIGPMMHMMHMMHIVLDCLWLPLGTRIKMLVCRILYFHSPSPNSL